MASSQPSMPGSVDFSESVDEEPRVASETAELDDNGSSSITSHEALGRHESSESNIAVRNGKPIFHTPEESNECVHEPTKRPQPTQSPKRKNRDASLSSGINLENLVNLKKAQVTHPTTISPISPYSLRNRTQSKLVYDVKYHPMDDAIRPSQAAKRRSAHGETLVVDSDDSSDAFTFDNIDAGAEESNDAETEEEEMPKQGKKAKTRKDTKSRPLPTEGTRRSTRKVSDLKTSYNMDIHPQDKFLVTSSDDEERRTPSNKCKKLARKRLNTDDDSGSDHKLTKMSQTSRHKQSRRTDLSMSDSLDPSGAPVLPIVETSNDSEHTIATTTPSHLLFVNSPPGRGIRRRKGMDVWHDPPGKRYLDHDRDYWPTLPDQPFEIFREKLEDQLAREATAASPLNYEHDNKENSSNANLGPPSDGNRGIFVMPSAQYRQSSDERQLADHRALVSDALYSDDAPQSYGLDGTHGTCEVQTSVPTEYMDILASGEHLPPGQTQVETQTDTQDSILDTDLIDEITGYESQVP